MQQTEKFQFDLIEPSDTFSPDPLNANARKTEAALTARPRVITGTYTGTGSYGKGSPTILEAADAERPPAMVIVSEPDGIRKAILIRGMPRCCLEIVDYQSHSMELIWTDKGVRCYHAKDSYRQMNSQGMEYHYAIFV